MGDLLFPAEAELHFEGQLDEIKGKSWRKCTNKVSENKTQER